MNEDKKKPRFPLALPDDLDKAIREYAKGDARRAPNSLNNTIVFLLRKGLEAALKEKSPGNRAPAQTAQLAA